MTNNAEICNFHTAIISIVDVQENVLSIMQSEIFPKKSIFLLFSYAPLHDTSLIASPLNSPRTYIFSAIYAKSHSCRLANQLSLRGIFSRLILESLA